MGESPSVPAAEVSAHSAVGGNEKGEFLGQEREGGEKGKRTFLPFAATASIFRPLPFSQVSSFGVRLLGTLFFCARGDVGRGTCGWRR